MIHTVAVVSSVLVLVAFWLLLWALALKIGLRWVKSESMTKSQLAAVALGMLVINVVINVGASYIPATTPHSNLAITFIGLIVSVALQCVLIMFVFALNSARAFKAWLPTLAADAASILVIVAVYVPFVADAFAVPSNSMAPTLLGKHIVGTCSQCGSPAYASELPPSNSGITAVPNMICSHFHITPCKPNDDHVDPSDRFLITKLAKPERWDLVVFRYPTDPSIRYVNRIVGLPGETIEIKDGAAWADGKRLTPPDSCSGLQYVATDDFGWPIYGTPENPAQLGLREYFVLGDFTTNSNDSRNWPPNANNLSPFALPEENIIGVVNTIYWPPSRWRAIK